MKKFNLKIFLIATVLIVLFAVAIFGCGDVLNRKKESVWTEIPYSITRGLLDTCNTLYYVTRQDKYLLVDCVTRIGVNDNYIIVSSNRNSKDSTMFWIIYKSIQDIEKIKKAENVEGPLDSVNFTARKQLLKINTLEFTTQVN
jgi:hypothetical protein